jgi:hypothetical protein
MTAITPPPPPGRSQGCRSKRPGGSSPWPGAAVVVLQGLEGGADPVAQALEPGPGAPAAVVPAAVV